MLHGMHDTGLLQLQINRLQCFQSVLIHIYGVARYPWSHVTHLRQSLHWLQIRKCITCKTAMLTFSIIVQCTSPTLSVSTHHHDPVYQNYQFNHQISNQTIRSHHQMEITHSSPAACYCWAWRSWRKLDKDKFGNAIIKSDLFASPENAEGI